MANRFWRIFSIQGGDLAHTRIKVCTPAGHEVPNITSVRHSSGRFELTVEIPDSNVKHEQEATPGVGLSDLREQKGIMDSVIREAIQSFESRTGCFVKDVIIERIFMVDRHPLLGGIKTEVNL